MTEEMSLPDSVKVTSSRIIIAGKEYQISDVASVFIRGGRVDPWFLVRAVLTIAGLLLFATLATSASQFLIWGIPSHYLFFGAFIATLLYAIVSTNRSFPGKTRYVVWVKGTFGQETVLETNDINYARSVRAAILKAMHT